MCLEWELFWGGRQLQLDLGTHEFDLNYTLWDNSLYLFFVSPPESIFIIQQLWMVSPRSDRHPARTFYVVPGCPTLLAPTLGLLNVMRKAQVDKSGGGRRSTHRCGASVLPGNDWLELFCFRQRLYRCEIKVSRIQCNGLVTCYLDDL